MADVTGGGAAGGGGAPGTLPGGLGGAGAGGGRGGRGVGGGGGGPPRGRRRGGRGVVGPGIVVAVTGVGAGDMVTSLVAGTGFGMALLWAVVLGARLPRSPSA